MKFNLFELLALINKLGPKFQEALPHLIALYKIISEAAGTNASLYAPAKPSKEYVAVLDAGKDHGATEDDMLTLANLVVVNAE